MLSAYVDFIAGKWCASDFSNSRKAVTRPLASNFPDDCSLPCQSTRIRVLSSSFLLASSAKMDKSKLKQRLSESGSYS